jgi:hypothetical protein
LIVLVHHRERRDEAMAILEDLREAVVEGQTKEAIAMVTEGLV